MSARFTSVEVCELAGVSMQALDRWVGAGLVRPTNNASGQGHHRRFGVLEATAIVYGSQYRDAGFTPDWVREVIAFVANQTEEQLEEAFEEGRTLCFAMPAHLGQSRMVEPVGGTKAEREMAKQLDLEACYRKVVREAQRREVESFVNSD